MTHCEVYVCEGREERERRQAREGEKERLIDYWMLSLFEDEGDIPMSFESDMGLTTPSMRFLLQSLMLPSDDSLGKVTPPVRSNRSSRARVLLRPMCWTSLTGENSWIEISSSFEAGLKYNI